MAFLPSAWNNGTQLKRRRIVAGAPLADNGCTVVVSLACSGKASADLEPFAANVGRLAQAVGRALEDDLAVAHHIDTP